MKFATPEELAEETLNALAAAKLLTSAMRSIG